MVIAAVNTLPPIPLSSAETRGSYLSQRGFWRGQNLLSKVTVGENRTGGQQAEPLPDLCRFLVHLTFYQPLVRMTAANFLEIIAVTLATCLNCTFCEKSFSARKNKKFLIFIRPWGPMSSDLGLFIYADS